MIRVKEEFNTAVKSRVNFISYEEFSFKINVIPIIKIPEVKRIGEDVN